MRKVKGFPYLNGGMYEDYVFVHVRGTGLEAWKTDWIFTLRPGDHRALNGSATVEYLEYKNETARLSITMGTPNMTLSPLTIETTLPDIPTTVDIFHSGLWYNRDFNGQGFDIQVKGERVVVTWYTFNQRDSATRFYIASGNIADGEYDLYTTDSEVLIPIGTIQLHFFEDGTTGVVNFNTVEHGRGSIHIEALLLSFNDKSGVFVTPGINLVGFSAHFYGDEIVMYWFTHGDYPALLQRTGRITRQRWFTFVGKKVDSEYIMSIYETTGGSFATFDAVTGTRVGVATLRADMSLDINIIATGINPPKGVLSLQRLF